MNLLKRLLDRVLPETPAPTLKSPVPWISDAVWSDWNRQPPQTDACPISTPQLCPVTASDQARAPRVHIQGASAPPLGDLASQHRHLLSTPPASGGVVHPFWPICCERLAVLISCNGGGLSLADVETQTGPLDLAYLETEIENGWAPRSSEELDKFLREGFRELLEALRRGKGEGGLCIFRCSSCERVYLASCEG